MLHDLMKNQKANDLALYLSSFDLFNPVSLAVPLWFEGPQPNFYGVPKASALPFQIGKLVGDTRKGGSCNFSQVTLIPHCNGTHTECVGHITHERISLNKCLKDVFIKAILISVFPEKASEIKETYPVLEKEDSLITKSSLKNALEKLSLDEKSNELPLAKALIIRTLPNDSSKQSQIYLEETPPFFSIEAISYIREQGFNHLIVDLPSIDRMRDEGKLLNHRIFWNVEEGSFEISPKTQIHNTITELAYISDEVEDGEYLLNLQITAFELEASPSRPIIFRKIQA
ncbi:MAG: cyclase family protein [Acidobacteria bacterium]|jgi:kynurenine formamidase|nr:MAG: cyclase family protein [Acidobacteriota bacterium]GIU82611.1 MAG: arylformamidase [Pyrinomonadaceae bacterium]